MISFKHDFPGKEALEAESKRHHNTLVHLIWDAEDILKVAAMWFSKDEEMVGLMPLAEDMSFTLSSVSLIIYEMA